MFKLSMFALVASASLATAQPQPPTPPGPPISLPPPSCTVTPSTQLVAIEQSVDAAPLALRAKIVVRSNGAWTYELGAGTGSQTARASGCLAPAKLAELKAELATGRPWMADLSALAAQVEEPGAIARSPGKPVH
jgi:hypothetical protein